MFFSKASSTPEPQEAPAASIPSESEPPTTSTSTVESSVLAGNFEEVVRQEEARLKREYPSFAEMPKCWNHMDTLLSCYSLRENVKAIYRYGHQTSCSEKAAEFKWCISNVWHPDEERHDMWIRRRAEWWARRRMGKSSEDVWEARSEPPPNFPVLITDEMLGKKRVDAN
ncbi:uncharacterized protein SCHCODRAFT_01158039 [Schizophyllum commune H4-8]|nr:uncharacterized protein SCHCODRAFT_01158039 [Schizophyllum commune H4-8]KAI5889519.1 hypothetical protein SCHCODRAFT_01158039 [Schizophyllum commune H4-8]